ncbi:WD40/YVTN/BNR-like repeat-containing protein [Sinomicrobium weinanense]|uniref:Oxidoreductase n=1 Tax=Sinomicrobium weinanense TaxID=2842200 RepID=A0A926JNT8_9FLAO|nr:oxidoreductase [Sinomicrobium weinanense]MBC9794713.1 oxidoreductase [Sinomicrobium weinanense]MBU3124972.1 oxidoreductase [Sinomicrobium weinanense]
MNRVFFLIVILVLQISCKQSDKSEPRRITGVSITPLMEDSMSVRAIEITPAGTLWFADDRGRYGYFRYGSDHPVLDSITYDAIVPHFRAIASNGRDIFLLGIGSPALLFKINEEDPPKLVYREEHKKAFYDAMTFWNENEGIAMGDPTGDCLSVLITRNGGDSWSKVPCNKLPLVKEGEAAFAASNTNIAVKGNKTWIVSGGLRSRVFYSPDKGNTWEVYDAPVVQGEPTLGLYSVDFWDKNHGIAIGGDYTRPRDNTANKVITTNGGKTWELIADKQPPGYRSCVQYVPGTGGKEVVAVGFEGISFSGNGGRSWKPLSKEGFYTIRFFNDSTAYAAGKGRLAKLELTKQKVK